MSTDYQPFEALPYLAINGILISNNATTPNTQIDVTTGMCRDSTNVFDLNLGNFGGAIDDETANVTTTIDATLNGLNGLDTGSLVASSMYCIYVISNPLGSAPTGLILSLNYPVAGGPVMPHNYFAYRLVGTVRTDSSSHFLTGKWVGTQNYRTFMYDAPVATSVTAGAATTYTNVSLFTIVPDVVDGMPVYIASSFTPGAASRTLSLAPPTSAGYARIVTGQVTSVVVTNTDRIISKRAVISSVTTPAIEYKVSNAGDAVAINVAGFDMFV